MKEPQGNSKPTKLSKFGNVWSRFHDSPLHERVNVAFTAVIALATVIYMLVSIKQWSLTRDALEQSKFVANRELRPYVLATKFDIIGDPMAGSDFTARIEITNSGHTPAVNLHGCADLSIHPDNKPMPNNIPCPNPENPPEKTHTKRIGEISTVTLSPNVPFTLNTPATRFKIEPDAVKQALAAQGILRIYIYGEITYSDMLDNRITHHTNFCGRYNPQTRAVNVCETHNGVD